MAHFSRTDGARTRRRLPVGVGLLIAFGVSAVLWSGLIWLVLRA